MWRSTVIAIVLASVLLAPQAFAVIYVDQNAPGPDHDGTTWSSAYLYLTDALAAAAANPGPEEIWVAQGVYYPDEGAGRSDNVTNQWFTIPNGTSVYGGFLSGQAALTDRNWIANKTILSGDIDKNDDNGGDFINDTYLEIVGSNAMSVVNATGTTDTTTRLDGFIITAGSNASAGAGIYAQNSSAGYYNLDVRGNKSSGNPGSGAGMLDSNGSPHLEHVTFHGNYAGGSAFSAGAGMHHDSNGHPVLIDVAFTNNTLNGNFGGGLSFWGGAGTIRNSTFSNNSSNYYGGGFCGQDSALIEFEDVVFTGNLGTRGGAMYLHNGPFTIKNALYSGNNVGTAAGNSGGGIYADNAANVKIVNAEFAGNSGWAGGGFYAEQATYSIVNSTFTGNSASNAGGGMEAGAESNGALVNVTFNGNQWNAIACWAQTSLTIRNSILWGDTGAEIKWAWSWTSYPLPAGSVTYSDVMGGWEGTTNINVDPLFVGGGSRALQSTSPAIDAGDNDVIAADGLDLDHDGNTTEAVPFDLDGNDRRNDGPMTDTGNGTAPIVDMGAYEYSAAADAAVDLTSSSNPAVEGATITLSAAVTDPLLAFTPTGNVIFRSDGVVITGCAHVSVAAGVAMCDTSALTLGTHTVTAFYTGDAQFHPASDSLDQEIIAAGLTAQTITFDQPPDQDFGTTPTLTASASSGLTVTFTSSTPAVCTITTGGALTFWTTGTCTIDADQPGDPTYAPAPTVTRSFTVNVVLPGAPTIGTAVGGNAEASVAFTPPAFDGGAPITGYTATSSPGGLTGTGTGSPIVVSGLSNGTAYTFTVIATNTLGTGPASEESNSVTPAGPPLPCEPVDDGDACTLDTCIEGVPVHIPIDLNDGDACTTDACDPVTGPTHTPIDPDDGNACTTDTCDPATGPVYTAVDVDDGNACTADSCDPASGPVHTEIPYDDGNACTADSCDPASGPVHTDIPYDDGNACTADSCDPASGPVHTPIAVDDGDACTEDSCDPVTGPVHTPIPYDDANACTEDSCDPATGPVHTPISYDDSNACTEDSCDPVKGPFHTPISYDDDNACTMDSCDPATGPVHTPISYDDSNACTEDSCDPVTGPVHTPISYDDANACTEDSCDPATGPVHTPISYDDSNACTEDSCDPVTGPVHTPISYDDLDACTTDTCDPVTGPVHTPISYDDANACTADSCDPAVGPVHTPISYDDANACTIDTCDPVAGVLHSPVNPDDGDVCTIDTCDPAIGVVHTPVTPDPVVITAGDPQYLTKDSSEEMTFCATLDVPDGTPVHVSVSRISNGASVYSTDTDVSDGTVCVTFDAPAAVDVYEVVFTMGSCFYTGSASTVLVVYDPDAGFLTGGGQFLYPGTTDRVNFGFVYSMSGGKKATLRGNLLAIRRLENGDVCRAKSNTLGAPAVVGTTATFSGKGNYVCTRPDGTTYDGAGNLTILGYVEDNGEPAVTTEYADRIWLSVPAPHSKILMSRPAVENAADLLHGNIQVPHRKK